MGKKLAFTLHAITSGKTSHRPGHVVEIDSGDFEDFIELGAVREPTDDELALYEQGKPKQAAKVAVEPAGEPEAAGELDPAPLRRETLEAEAKELGVKFQKNTSDDKLAERIAEAKAETAESGEDDDLVG
jgi:hypothetical protein